MTPIAKNTSLNIDVVSDVVCPWCYVGKRYLDLAIDQLPDIEFFVRWRPYQLNPQMPEEGMDRDEYMAKKFGPGEPTTSFYKNLETIGSKLAIDFRFQDIKLAPNTFNAHRLIHWAGGSSKSDATDDAADPGYNQTTMVTKMFEAYFEQGRDLGDCAVLVEIADSLGMNGGLVEELLAGDRDVDAIKEQVSVAAKMGITGVPCFIVDNKYAVMGAQNTEVLVETFGRIAQEKKQEQTDAD